MNPLKLDEETIYHVARRIAHSEARAAYLEQICAGDQALRGRVERLLQVCEQEASFLEVPACGATVDLPTTAERPGTIVGPYKLREQIGEGGMGVVYVAEQTQPVRRKVALKIIKPGMDTKQVIGRFEAERQALAMMDHPNIAKVHDGGTTESGRPYFVMELVRGLPITEYCDAERLSIRDRLDLFVLVCRAVQHAHQKGIIHRDLKPSNILVTLHDGVPVPKVIDFGVAKATGQSLTERTIYTAFAQLVGTPLYMSPEQVEMSGLDVDTRSDIYSLGVLLYELLTGTTPFDSDTLKQAAFDEMRRIIREQEPPKPSTRLSTLGAKLLTTSAKRSADPRRLNRSVQGELDWIVMKALEKDRRRRYETANDFAADVSRYLTDQPVEACPPSARYRFQKFARRNKAVLTTAALVVAALCIGALVSTWQAVRATQAEGRAESQRKLAESSAAEAQRQTKEARKAQGNSLRAKQEADHQRNAVSQNLYYADMRLGLVDWTAGNIGRLSGKLFSHAPRGGGEDQRGWEWYYLLALCHQDEQTLMGHNQGVSSIGWSPDGRRFASTGSDGVVTIYDALTWKILRTWETDLVWGGHWSPDSRRLAWTTTAPDNGLYLGQVETGEKVTLRRHQSSTRRAPAWSPDGKHLAESVWSVIRLWDPVTGSSIGVLEGTRADIGSLAWGPDGKLLVLGGDGQQLKTWDPVSGEGSRTVPSMTGMSSAAWSPDGKRLALGMGTGKCRVYKTTDWSVAGEWDAHTGSVNSVAWNPDGGRLASAGADHLIQVWDPATGHNLLTLSGHLNHVTSLAWEPNGRRLASGGADGLVKVWALPLAPQPRRLEGHAGGVRAIAWSEDGKTLRSLGATDGTIALWNVVNGQPLSKVRVPASAAAQFSPGGKLLAIATSDQKTEILIHNTRSGELVQTVKKARVPAAFSAFSPDASKLALSNGPILEIVDLRLDEVPFRWESRGYHVLSWSPDGRLLAAAGRGEPNTFGSLSFGAWVHVFDIEKRERLFKGRHGVTWAPVTTIGWSPDGHRLVSGGVDGLAEVWEPTSGHKVASAQMHAIEINAMTWSPDGRRVASASGDGTVRVWDPIHGEELLRLDVPQKAIVRQLEWSPDGRRLAGATAEGAVLVWDATAGFEFARSETYAFEQVHHALDQATRLWATSRKNEALALIDQTLDAHESKPVAFPRWVGESIRTLVVNTRSRGQVQEVVDLHELIQPLAKLSINDGLPYVEIGVALSGACRVEEGIAANREAVRRLNNDGNLVVANLNLAELLRDSDRLPEAESAYGRARDLSEKLARECPDDPDYRFWLSASLERLGLVLLETGRLGEAESLMRRSFAGAEKLASEFPDRKFRPELHASLGIVEYRVGDWKAALASLKKRFELGGAGDVDTEAELYLAMTYWQLGDNEQARKAHDQAMRWMDEHPTAEQRLLHRLRAEATKLLSDKQGDTDRE
jgi:WD40 repeat protein/serine/threonine protein kinase